MMLVIIRNYVHTISFMTALLTIIFILNRRRSSAVGSIDSGGSDVGGLGGHHHKTRYRVLVMGKERVGKTSIISQFLYDQFSTKYKVRLCNRVKVNYLKINIFFRSINYNSSN